MGKTGVIVDTRETTPAFTRIGIGAEIVEKYGGTNVRGGQTGYVPATANETHACAEWIGFL